MGSSYLGLFIYVVFPAFFVIGLILIPVGMYFKRKKNKLRLPEDVAKFPIIDFNQKKYRNAFVVFGTSTLIILFATSIGSYETFHYTESVEFCGTLCHEVMEPEYVTYQNSPHARVACVECHVGEGADWYMRSKLSGLRQVYAVLTDSYKRPIETPLHNLRPAKETCERCHWPEKFYPNKLRVNKSFLSDSVNTEWDIMLKMKLGPDYTALGYTEGIHWHINKNVKIEYISDNKSKSKIPWVKYTDLTTGKSKIFQDYESPASDSLMEASKPNTMDCIDCHNRPSHSYKSPKSYIANAMISGKVSKDIPFIKSKVVEVLSKQYSSKDSSFFLIDKGLKDYYKTNFAAFYKTNKVKIDNSIKAIQLEYSLNSFPSMQADFTKYPNHIGHQESEGCFRCHSGNHKTESGETISRDCNLCHTIVAQGNPSSLEKSPVTDALEFKHPVDIEGVENEMHCSDCHSAM